MNTDKNSPWLLLCFEPKIVFLGMKPWHKKTCTSKHCAAFHFLNFFFSSFNSCITCKQTHVLSRVNDIHWNVSVFIWSPSVQATLPLIPTWIPATCALGMHHFLSNLFLSALRVNQIINSKHPSTIIFLPQFQFIILSSPLLNSITSPFLFLHHTCPIPPPSINSLFTPTILSMH